MLGGKLILMVTLCQGQSADPDQEPAALVAQLGSARYASREAAAQALERLGRPALTALAAPMIRRTPRSAPEPGCWLKKLKMPC